jgi:hypothetical protein
MAPRRLWKALLTLLVVGGALLLAPTAWATIYDPPWADMMWSHYPGGGGLDTSGTMGRVKTQWKNIGYTAFSTNPSSARVAMGTSYAQSDAIWWMAGHASAGNISTYNASTGVTSYVRVNNSSGSCASPNACLTNYTPSQLHRIRLMVFQGCNSGDSSGGQRLQYYAKYTLGVDATIAFTELIYFGSDQDYWGEQLAYLTTNSTHDVEDAAWAAADFVFMISGSYWGYDSMSMYGAAGTYMDPPAYGS